MKPKTVLLGFAVLALAGCGSNQPAYTAHGGFKFEVQHPHITL
ncbi:hypothetical protein [Candidatus Igneacidithiobacillus taiwanensis]|nr:hypothetical protein [Candidatus Igneacidithiobacillus taiwanensis]